jgi:hypothetical protein
MKRNITNKITTILPAERAITLGNMARFVSLYLQAELNPFLHPL